MRVLVAGATGAIGRPLVPLLSTAGHEVIGLTRSAEKAEALRLTGAEA
ncbi:MAG: NAD-dependent epimerase/dehydratase family protein, partial [Thermoleophilaceae bacterium]|nr:NAD-dependent epimerase/dehydratase family protein [Thermoleophilaceae bacterium]